ncbi:hypothetical protein H0H92_007490 [Tricholoma furcatifolium]|nr:hypothetical protein H0H92_007490 [Tricholoma furcatifolium]
MASEDILQSSLDNAFSPPPSRRQSAFIQAAPVSEDILKASLDKAFSPAPSRRQSAFIHAVPGMSEAVAALKEPEESSLSNSVDEFVWKSEYESHVQTWRAQSSEARVKAEKERERWEAVREDERKEAERRKALGILESKPEPEPEPEPTSHEHESGWENVSQHSEQSTVAATVIEHPTPAESVDSLPAQPNQSSSPPVPSTTAVTRPHSQADTRDGSQKWEDIHASVTSSYPSLEYPERRDTPSPSHRLPAPQRQAPLNATLAVFDSTLSTRTRVKALFSSLAINMLLPFVNGVMLGFGEIFAKNVVMQWFGWQPTGPGYVAASTGISSSIRSKTPWSR